MRRRIEPGTLVVSILAAVMLVALPLSPASADVVAAPDCAGSCTSTFDTVGAGFEFEVPVGSTDLFVTLAGGAGAPPAHSLVGDPTAVGGPGGVTTVNLGSDYAGQTLRFAVGGTGQGSALQDSDAVANLLAVAGGGGQGGYAGRFDLPDQIFATYPGGEGGAPSGPGIAPGGDATAFGASTANGTGGTAAMGTGGLGIVPGSDGGPTTTITPTGPVLASGGLGGDGIVGGFSFPGGAGGSGLTGGGGGAYTQVDGGDDITIDLAAPGGGGSGYLAAFLTAVAGEPNTGSGYVSFTWTMPAPPAPALATTGAQVDEWVPVAAALLLALGAGMLFAARRRANR